MDNNMYNNTQVGRIDGKNCFLEILSDMFDRNKVIIKFISYDERTHKQTGCIPVFLSIEDFLVLCEDINMGTLSRKAFALKNEGKGDKIYEKLGGTVSQGAVASRVFQIFPATKSRSALFMFSAILASGIRQDTGLITPDYKKPFSRIMVPVSENDIRGLFLKTKLRIEAFYCYQSVSGAFGSSVPGTQASPDVPQQVVRRSEEEKNHKTYEGCKYSLVNDYYPAAVS